ncbi:MAG: alpha/beta fold hydrolase [Actinomycetota bacterium]
MTDVLPGAEARSVTGGTRGALVLHGFTGNPSSMRPIADAFEEAGWSVELPRLPGHGTTVDDMLTTSYPDWIGEVEAAWARLVERTEHQVVVGLSMGGTLTAEVATRHEPAGAVFINAAIAPIAAEMQEGAQQLIDGGAQVMPGIGSDIAKEGVVESAYPETPLLPLLSLAAAVDELQDRLADIRCPILVLTSPEDHVVPPESSDHLAAAVSGPVRRISLDRSYHVATLDHDAELIISEALAFADEVTA